MSTIKNIKRETVTIDATGKVVGRLATHIAKILIGKDKPTYVPHIDAGAIVKVLNADKIVLTGKKMEQKVHFRSSNRPSGVKATPMSRLMKENPGEILVHAVKYMLPKNRTQNERLKRLIIA
ncbi:50S ribosomal protein L13 [Candidatus Uhrbacteria bacterium]|jgi:large subunit ribosomal protein L13|nr:MAG: 50S ribosomal protein L13 [Candidatus Uhrbacteria bacterium]